ncbi:MAG TPA: ATP-binding protein [Candidatus Angelobacter sp.]
MNWLRSFRWRILLGTLLWSLGLIPLLHWLFLVVHHQTRLIPRHYLVVFFLSGFLFIMAGIWQFRAGLLPFGRLRRQLSGLRDGSSRRIEGTYPMEVQPLVNDLNSLLEHRERIVQRALAKAGDLAHGLKTPLAVLAQEADRAESAGQHEMASMIGLQVERMRRQVDYHLAHARAAGSGDVPGARCPVLPSVEGLTRTLLRIHAGRGLAIQVDVSPEHFIRGQREDLEEMLGNLLDNACKWAKSNVRIQSVQEDGVVVLTIDDDGPGLPPGLRDAVLQRGVRADQAAPGSGLGLAIVRDLAELYAGTIALEDSPLGGLRARLRLPA